MQAMLMAQPEGHGICDGLDLLCWVFIDNDSPLQDHYTELQQNYYVSSFSPKKIYPFSF